MGTLRGRSGGGHLLAVLAVALLAESGVAQAAEWHVTTSGAPMGQGTVSSPWDLESALSGKQKIAPGDLLWVHGGTYKRAFELRGLGFVVRLAGRSGAPIQVRGGKGERATIDGGLDVQPPSTHLWIRDLEINVSEPRPEKPVPPDQGARALNRPWGGLNVATGTECKYINLVIHDNCQGVSFWSGATESELYGCLIYDNGWQGADRGHGHAIYTQNETGTKTIADCIMTGGYGYSLHAYGERGQVSQYRVEGNIVYNAGTFLIGGYLPSKGIRVLGNFLYALPMQLGYAATENEDCEVRDNLVVRGGIAINHFKKVVNEGNLVVKDEEARPKGVRVVLRPNRYDPDRAHVAVFNWDRSPTVAIDPAGFLSAGDRFRLLNPRDFFGGPVQSGIYEAKPLSAPVAGEFAAFVLLKGGALR